MCDTHTHVHIYTHNGEDQAVTMATGKLGAWRDEARTAGIRSLKVRRGGGQLGPKAGGGGKLERGTIYP